MTYEITTKGKREAGEKRRFEGQTLLASQQKNPKAGHAVGEQNSQVDRSERREEQEQDLRRVKGRRLGLGIERISAVDIRSPERGTQILPLLTHIRPHRQGVNEGIAVTQHDFHPGATVKEGEGKQEKRECEKILDQKPTTEDPSWGDLSLLIRHKAYILCDPPKLVLKLLHQDRLFVRGQKRRPHSLENQVLEVIPRETQQLVALEELG